METCCACGGTAKVIACIEDSVIIKKILNHLQELGGDRFQGPGAAFCRPGCCRILLPDIEINLYGQNDPQVGVSAGLSDSKTGLRLRYEIRREFVPYVGVNWTALFGNTSELARISGRETVRNGAGDRPAGVVLTRDGSNRIDAQVSASISACSDTE